MSWRGELAHEQFGLVSLTVEEWFVMGMFGRSKGVVCPVCSENLGRNPHMGAHNVAHALPAQDGRPGFMWRCGCGEFDGVWRDQVGAAAGLTMHMRQRHGIQPF